MIFQIALLQRIVLPRNPIAGVAINYLLVLMIGVDPSLKRNDKLRKRLRLVTVKLAFLSTRSFLSRDAHIVFAMTLDILFLFKTSSSSSFSCLISENGLSFCNVHSGPKCYLQ